MFQILVGFLVPLALSPATAFIISTQYHAQDGLGSYSYGHSGGPSSKLEYGTPDGRVSGSYSYIDGNGMIQTAHYSADPVNGFTVQASNLPVAPNPPPAHLEASISAPVDRPLGVPVVDTHEVAAAKAAHLSAVEHQKKIVAAYPSRRRRSIPIFSYFPFDANYGQASTASADRPLGEPVVDTPEVAAAKISHLTAVEHQKSIVAPSLYRWGNNVYPPFGFSYLPAPYLPVTYKSVSAFPLKYKDIEDVSVSVTDTPEVAAA